jgi:hypothetical protein
MAANEHPGGTVLLKATHRPQPRLEPAVVSLDAVVAYRSVQCHAAGSSSSSTTGYVAAWSVTTSTGVTLIVPIARSKNRCAAVASRREETNTSMTCPNWSIARYT